MGDARKIIDKLSLEPHPEGGFFREIWRSDVTLQGGPDKDRATATSIYFLLRAGERSAWHRVDADEIWYWHAGDPLIMSVKERRSDTAQQVTLGPEVLAGQQPQFRIPADYWQAADPLADGPKGFTLVSCVVSPGFEFAGFELAE